MEKFLRLRDKITWINFIVAPENIYPLITSNQQIKIVDINIDEKNFASLEFDFSPLVQLKFAFRIGPLIAIMAPFLEGVKFSTGTQKSTS